MRAGKKYEQKAILFEEYLEGMFQSNEPTKGNHLRKTQTPEEEDIRLVTPREVAEEISAN